MRRRGRLLIRSMPARGFDGDDGLRLTDGDGMKPTQILSNIPQQSNHGHGGGDAMDPSPK